VNAAGGSGRGGGRGGAVARGTEKAVAAYLFEGASFGGCTAIFLVGIIFAPCNALASPGRGKRGVYRPVVALIWQLPGAQALHGVQHHQPRWRMAVFGFTGFGFLVWLVCANRTHAALFASLPPPRLRMAPRRAWLPLVLRLFFTVGWSVPDLRGVLVPALAAFV